MSEKIISSDTAYRNKFSISQSSIKDWKIMPPKKWHDTWVTKTLARSFSQATVLGSYLDCLMFTPKDLEKRFIVASIPLPSEKVTKILTDAFNHVEELNKNAKVINITNPGKTPIPMKKHTLEDKELIVSLCQLHDHYKSKPDQAYNDVLKKGTAYFEFLQTTKGKQVISTDDDKKAKKMQEVLLNDKVSKPFFDPKKGCEVVFQVRIFAEFSISGFDNVEFLPTKGAIDIVHINNKRKEVREVDLKYTNDVFMFWDAIKRFDYPGQHSFYDYLLKEWLKTYKDGRYKDYAVMPPLNVVIDDDLIPYIYAYNMDDLQIKRYGVENTPIRGWEDVINDIAWHFDNGDWSRPREHQQNGYLSVRTFNKTR